MGEKINDEDDLPTLCCSSHKPSTKRICDKVIASLLVPNTCNCGGAYAGQTSPDCDSVHHVDDDAEGETDGW